MNSSFPTWVVLGILVYYLAYALAAIVDSSRPVTTTVVPDETTVVPDETTVVVVPDDET
jgi:hypothetical protein